MSAKSDGDGKRIYDRTLSVMAALRAGVCGKPAELMESSRALSCKRISGEQSGEVICGFGSNGIVGLRNTEPMFALRFSRMARAGAEQSA